MKKIMIIIIIVQRSLSLSTRTAKMIKILKIYFKWMIGNKIIRILRITIMRRWKMWIFKIISKNSSSKKIKKTIEMAITKVQMIIRMIRIGNQIIILSPKIIDRRVIVSSHYSAMIHRCFNPSQDTTIHLIACKRKQSRNGKLRKRISHKDTHQLRMLKNRRFFRD